MNLKALVVVIGITAAGLTPACVRADDSVTNTVAAKPTPYPLNVCPVSDEKLGEMGKAYVFVYEGQEIKFCCSGCKKDFLKEPKKYLKKIKELAAKQKKSAAASPQ
jgi:YHS domain-containing protein